jgi:hypothetical protein
MIACGEAGRYLAHRRAKRDPDGAWLGIGVVDGAIFGLLGLIVAFTFSGAASRFDARRNLIVEETNTIGTAYLRLDLLPGAAQPANRDKFKQYVDSRIRVYRLFPDEAAVNAELDKGRSLQNEIWTLALAGVEGSQPATMLLLPALNQTFDIATTRTMTLLAHPPRVIFMMLFGLALVAATAAGYSMANSRSRNWLHILGLATVMSVAFYVILDLEHPRLGYIQIEAFDLALADLRKSMR